MVGYLGSGILLAGHTQHRVLISCAHPTVGSPWLSLRQWHCLTGNTSQPQSQDVPSPWFSGPEKRPCGKGAFAEGTGGCTLTPPRCYSSV
jgi:hypothetical protein